jgi:TPR repeat protein
MARLETKFETGMEAAAFAGTIDIYYQLGLEHCSGCDRPIDLVEAHKWFAIAAQKGNDEARRYRQELTEEMSKDEVMRAQRLAREWLARN